MKVLHAAETIHGGVATVMRSLLADQLSRPGVEARCLIPQAHMQEMRAFPATRIATFGGRKRSLFRHLRFTLAFIKQVMLFRPDVVHLHSTFAGVLGRLALLTLWPFHRPRVIYCPHAFAFLMATSVPQKSMYALVERTLAPLAHAVICVSRQERAAALAAGLPAAKLHLVYNGVLVQKETIPVPNGKILQLLFVGRFHRAKGLDILQEAMKIMAGKPLHLTVIGAPEPATPLPPNRPGQTYLGWLSPQNVALHMQEADVIVVPSRWEGFAMVPLEAMALGRPVVVSDATSLTEVVEAGRTGQVFRSGDAADLARVLTTPTDWPKLGAAARQHHAAHFTAEKMTAQTFALYQKGTR